MGKDEKLLKSITDKYKNRKEEGFKTTSTKDLQKERDSIKKSYYVKGFFLFIVTIVLLALFLMLTGNYEKKRGGVDKIEPIADSIDVGSGNPGIEIVQEQIKTIQENQERDRLEYQQRLAEKEAQYKKDIAALEEKVKEAEETAKQQPQPVIVDSNESEEKLVSLKNEVFSELEEFKKSILAEKKNVVIPQRHASSGPAPQNTPPSRPEKPQVKMEEYEITTMSLREGDAEKEAAEATEKEAKIGFSIVTGLSKALLVTGVQAPTYGGGLKNPKPVMVSFTTDILIPNDRSINIKDCNGLGTAIGNPNTKRAEITLTRLNCIVEQNGQIYKVEEKVEGYAIGEDGAYGIVGRLVDSGAKIAMREAQVGFLQGVVQILQASATPSSPTYFSSSGGGIVTPSFLSGSSAASYAAASGGQSGLASLAEYYKSMMDGLYPTISVRAGREIGILWHGGETITMKATKIFDVDGTNNSNDLEQPFATEASEVLRYDEW
jgi:conjugal transfer pilus assembly protein TraB